MDVKEIRSKILLFYLAKSFTERLEAGELHDSMIVFTFLNGFRRCSAYSCDGRIAQKAAEPSLVKKCFEPPIVLSKL